MLRTRIVLLIAGISISALLFFLPMAVVDNEKEEMVTTNEEDHSSHDHEEFDHNASSIDPVLQEKINNLRELFLSSGNNEKSITFADSLATLFTSVQKLDSVIKYREWIASNFPNEENIEFAGLAYYEAFGYAIDDEKAIAYGEKAREYLGKVFEKYSDRLDLKTKIAMTYVSSKNPMQGIVMLREVIASDPEHQEALFNLGLLARQSGQLEKAVERFENIVKLNPNHVQARFLLAVTYKDMGNITMAKEHFEIVKRTDNDPAVLATVDAYLEEIK